MTTREEYEGYDPRQITDYWEKRYKVWAQSPNLNIFRQKDEWFETRFAHILPNKHLGDCVLDFGCGNAMYSPALLRRYRFYYGVDTSPTSLDIARKYIGESLSPYWAVGRYEQGDPLPFGNDFFDCVISITVLQHLPVPLRVFYIEEIKRVLKPSGIYVGLEMNHGQAADMPNMQIADWKRAWWPIDIQQDLPASHPDWWDDNVWVGRFTEAE